MAALKAGDRVKIIGGTYKKHGAGTYKGPCINGTKMARVAIDNDTRMERNLMLTSIAPLKEQPRTTKTEEIKTVLKEMAAARKQLEELEVKLEKLLI